MFRIENCFGYFIKNRLFTLKFFLFFILINQMSTYSNGLLSPLTQLRTVHECHIKSTNLNLNCNIGHRIRILESFYGVSMDHNRDFCTEGYKEKDCKSYTSFQNACNGRTSCSVHFFQAFLSECNANSDYLTVLYECVPESRIHGVCSNIEDFSPWGTLRTTDFPQPYRANEDCWCKLVADNNQRIVLSVISFQLFPYDPTCSEAGLYLQSDRKRSKECTFLQQGHYYISSSKHLYLNFYSKKPTVRGGFWIIYEASDAKSKIHLKCGDTDEVRPADFTRFSTKKENLFTPFIYELATTTIENELSVKEYETPIKETNSPIIIDSQISDIFEKTNFKEIINKFFFTTSTRPITNTFNLLNRKTTTKSAPTDKQPAITTFDYLPFFYKKNTTTISRFTRNKTLSNEIPNIFFSSSISPISPITKSSKLDLFSFETFSKYLTTTSNIIKFSTVNSLPHSFISKTNKVYYKTRKNSSIYKLRTRTTSTTSTTTSTTTTTTTTIKTTTSTTAIPTTIMSTTTTSITTTIVITTTTQPIYTADFDYLTSNSISNSTETFEEFSSPVKQTDEVFTQTNAPNLILTTSNLDYELSSTSSVLTDGEANDERINNLTVGYKNATLDESLDYLLFNNSFDLNHTEFMSAISLQENMKKSTENKNLNRLSDRKLSKTELTIIISCILFITLLTLINLLIYSLKKVLKKSNKKVVEANLNSDTGKKSYDILPGVGEIVLWADKDKRGYLIDINGSWAKIDGQRWIRDNMAVLHNTYKKASMAYRNKFKKKDEKKAVGKEDSRLIKRPPPTNGTYILPTVPEAAEYETSDNSSSASIVPEEIHIIEADYHIEHGRVTSFAKNPKILCQSSSVLSNMRDNKPNSLIYSGNESSNYYDQNKSSLKYDGANSGTLTDTTESNYYQENQDNNEPYSQPDQVSYNHNISNSDLESQKVKNYDSNGTDQTSDTDTEPAFIIKRPILIKGDAEFLKNFPHTFKNDQSDRYYPDNCSKEINQDETKNIKNTKASKETATNVQQIIEKTEQNSHFKHGRNISQPLQRNLNDVTLPENNNSGVKLDPSILKYSNQPIAIVAPNKSNSNTLEKKHKQIEEIPTISLRTINVNQVNQPPLLQLIQQRRNSIHQQIIRQIIADQSNENEESDYEVSCHVEDLSKDQHGSKLVNSSSKPINNSFSFANGIEYSSSQNFENLVNEQTENSSQSQTSSSCSILNSECIPPNELNSFNAHGSKSNQDGRKNKLFHQINKSNFTASFNNSVCNIDNVTRIKNSQRDSGFIEEKTIHGLNLSNEEESEKQDIIEYGKPPNPIVKKFSSVHNDTPMNKRRQLVNSHKSIEDSAISLKDSFACGSDLTYHKSTSSAVALKSFDKSNNPENSSSYPNSVYYHNNINTVTFNNDENSFMCNKEMNNLLSLSDMSQEFCKTNVQNETNTKPKTLTTFVPTELNPATLNNHVMIESNQNNNDQSYSTLNNKRFSKALQKACLIENMITKHSPVPNELNDNNGWMKRQIIAEESNENENKILKQNLTDKIPVIETSNQKPDLNFDEFQFFITAIEKLKATNLFQEEDLKKMTDEQIYDALVAHARKLRNNKQSPGCSPGSTASCCSHNLPESIDKEQEDLPIIMKNLHSVKSLKHFFEIRAKTSFSHMNNCNLNEQPSTSNYNSPAVQLKRDENRKSVMLHDMFLQSNKVIESSIKQGVGIAIKDTESEIKINVDQKSIESINENKNSNQNESDKHVVQKTPVTPLAPPLPDFLIQPKPKFSIKVRTSSSNSNSENIYSTAKESIYGQTNQSQDLHEKLIKEIHNKSLERSRKDSSLYFDEHGNLINRPITRLNNLTQFKNHKLSKIKDNLSYNAQHSNIAEKISQLAQKTNQANLAELKLNSFRYNKNRNQSDISTPKNSAQAILHYNIDETQNQQNLNKSKLNSEYQSNLNTDNNEYNSNIKQNEDNNKAKENDIIEKNDYITVNNQIIENVDLRFKLESVNECSILIEENKKIINQVFEKVKKFDENDNVSEMTSMTSQIPSMLPTLERKAQIVEMISGNSSDPRNYHQINSNLNKITDSGQNMISSRTDFSRNSTNSAISTRSMLSEAKAKLEAFGKFSKNTSHNSKAYLESKMNHSKHDKKFNEEKGKNNLNVNYQEEQNYYQDDEDYIQTKF